MGWNDALRLTNNAAGEPAARARRLRLIAVVAGGAALLAFALVLATRQYDAHAPNESAPPPSFARANGQALAAANQAALAGGIAAQNIVPGAMAANPVGDVLGGPNSAANSANPASSTNPANGAAAVGQGAAPGSPAAPPGSVFALYGQAGAAPASAGLAAPPGGLGYGNTTAPQAAGATGGVGYAGIGAIPSLAPTPGAPTTGDALSQAVARARAGGRRH